jgi:hypothetical protein
MRVGRAGGLGLSARYHGFGRRSKPASISRRMASERDTPEAAAHLSIASTNSPGGRNATSGVMPVGGLPTSLVSMRTTAQQRGSGGRCTDRARSSGIRGAVRRVVGKAIGCRSRQWGEAASAKRSRFSASSASLCHCPTTAFMT